MEVCLPSGEVPYPVRPYSEDTESPNAIYVRGSVRLVRTITKAPTMRIIEINPKIKTLTFLTISKNIIKQGKTLEFVSRSCFDGLEKQYFKLAKGIME